MQKILGVRVSLPYEYVYVVGNGLLCDVCMHTRMYTGIAWHDGIFLDESYINMINGKGISPYDATAPESE